MGNIICGFTKVTVAIPACPIVGVGSFLAGIGYTSYGCITCNSNDEKFLEKRNKFCNWCGVVEGVMATSTLCASGLENINIACNTRKPIVESDMYRN